MSTSSVSSSDLYTSLGLTNTASSSSSTASATPQLDEQDFLKLMTEELQDQDPLNPVSNSEYFSQIAQFSTVSGIDKLNTQFSTLSSQLSSSQSLQATSLIGHTVVVPGTTAELTSSGLAGAVAVPSSGDVQVSIKDSTGATVETLDLGTQSAGTTTFTWDGTNSAGTALPTGNYTISATVATSSGTQSATTYVAGQVESVSLGSSGALTLNLQGIGSVSMDDVLQII